MGERKRIFRASHVQNRISRSHKTITIGVGGVTKGVGSSHLTFLLSTYFNKNRNRTAVVERNESSCFSKIEEAYEGINFVSKAETFEIKKRTFYKNYKGLLSGVKNGPYDVLIIDYGELKGHMMNEFNGLDIKLVIGYGNEWRLHEFDSIAEKEEGHLYNYIVNFGNRDEEKLFKQFIKRKAMSLPYIKDPFHWTKDVEKMVEQILNER